MDMKRFGTTSCLAILKKGKSINERDVQESVAKKRRAFFLPAPYTRENPAKYCVFSEKMKIFFCQTLDLTGKICYNAKCIIRWSFYFEKFEIIYCRYSKLVCI